MRVQLEARRRGDRPPVQHLARRLLRLVKVRGLVQILDRDHLALDRDRRARCRDLERAHHLVVVVVDLVVVAAGDGEVVAHDLDRLVADLEGERADERAIRPRGAGRVLHAAAVVVHFGTERRQRDQGVLARAHVAGDGAVRLLDVGVAVDSAHPVGRGHRVVDLRQPHDR